MRRVLRNCLAPSGLLPCAPEVSSHGSSEEGAGPSSVRAEWPASIPFMPPRPASTGTGRDQPNPGAVCPFCRHLTADTVQCDRCGGAVLMSYVAVHEAAHAVITYRAAGYVGGNTSIVPNSTGLGRVHDSVLDVRNPFHVRGSILSVYAGGHAARELDPVFGQEGCGTDERIALAMLRFAGWVNLELSFRQRSLDLVRLHMTEIVAVARELLKVRELTADQVIAIADRAAGVAPFGEYVVFTRDRAIGALFSWLLRAAQRTPRVWKTLAQLVRAVPNEQGTWAPILSDPRRWPSSHSEPSRPES